MAGLLTLGATLFGGGQRSGLSLELSVVGLNEVERLMLQYGRDAEKALESSLFEKGERIMGDAKGEVPRRDGHLINSGHVPLPAVEGGFVVVRPAFGGVAAPYAFRQHEELGYSHKVGKAKYLEDPARRHFDGIDEWIAKDMRAKLPR